MGGREVAQIHPQRDAFGEQEILGSLNPVHRASREQSLPCIPDIDARTSGAEFAPHPAPEGNLGQVASHLRVPRVTYERGRKRQDET